MTMDIVRLNSKNQVVIPKEIRRTLGLQAGDEILFIARKGIVYLLPKTASRLKVLNLKGSLAGLPTVGFREKRDRL